METVAGILLHIGGNQNGFSITFGVTISNASGWFWNREIGQAALTSP